MQIESFVITLDRATERKAQVARIKSLCPVACHEISAIDGRQLTSDERNQVFVPFQYRPYYPFQLRDGEIGVFLSHRKAWQEIVDRDLDAGLILEDDVAIDPQIFPKGFQFAESRLKPDQIYKFSTRARKINTPSSADRPMTANSPSVVPLGAQAQLVGRIAALRLLALTETFDRPIDSFIQLSWLTKVDIIMVEPSGVTEVSQQLGGSTIQVKQRPKAETAYRNLIRPIYRSQIRLMSAWNAIAN